MMVKSAVVAALWLVASAAADPDAAPSVIVHAPGDAAFSVSVVDGRPMLGPAKPAKLGAGAPQDGEILISVRPPGLAPYATFTVVEKTAQPVDFVVTGLIDTIKIDEVEVCGRLGAPIAGKIAAGARKLSLNRFTPQKEGASCP